MAGICLIKRGDGLFAADGFAEERLARVKDGQRLLVETKRARSGQQHNFFFAGLATLYDNQEQFKSETDLREALLVEAGYSELRERIDGSRYRVARSMAWHNMNHDEFTECFNAVKSVTEAHFGFDPWEHAR